MVHTAHFDEDAARRPEAAHRVALVLLLGRLPVEQHRRGLGGRRRERNQLRRRRGGAPLVPARPDTARKRTRISAAVNGGAGACARVCTQ